MAFLPSIPHTRWRGSRLFLNLPIPRDLRHRFKTAKGTDRTHIVEALGTGDPGAGRRLARERQAYWELEFATMRRGHRPELPSTLRKAKELRQAMAVVRAEGNEAGEEAIQNMAIDHAERIEQEAGEGAAVDFYRLATTPEKLTLLEALEKLNEVAETTEATKGKRAQVLRDLLLFLKVPDCLPEYVTQERALAYVDWLNESSGLGYSTKRDRMSLLNGLWKFLARRRQIPQGTSPWRDQELTGRKKSSRAGQADRADEKRGWRSEEILALFQAPDRPAKTYHRSLFRELYTLGFITGMRLDEIVSLSPAAVELREWGVVLSILESKTDAGVRTIPVTHPAAVSILKARRERQREVTASLFPECRPGGPDNRLSWQVQKAMGRDRDRLGFGTATDFHSTRRTFMTSMERGRVKVSEVQRYVGHRVGTLMHDDYSDGLDVDHLLEVARAVKYPPEVEEEFRKAAGLSAPECHAENFREGI